jgi:hypothetical protein
LPQPDFGGNNDLEVVMSVSSLRICAAVFAGLGLASLSACSTAPSKSANNNSRTPAFYWAAAGETYAAGNYAKTADHLEKVLESDNDYTARAIPWYLVVTSGMARGYTELADRYTTGARFNKTNALVLRRTATKYRAIAGKLALRFAQDVDRLQKIPLGKVPLAFGMPKGSAAEPPLLTRVGSGIALTPADQEAAEAVALQRGVLMTVCQVAGAPNDTAKAREILGHPSADVTREAFANAVAQLLKTESSLFARDKLDEPEKVAAFQKRAEIVLAEGAKVGSARIGLLVNASPTQ